MERFEIITHSEDETLQWAEHFAKSLKPGDAIAFYGNLGAGKTLITRGICKGLNYTGTVCSPTYTILHEYPNEPPIFHLDLYRLNSGSDLEEIGLSRCLSSQGITLLEWAEKLENRIGITHTIQIEILNDSSRKIIVQQKNPGLP